MFQQWIISKSSLVDRPKQTGGNSADKAGIIYPEEVSEIHVTNYSGHVKVIYTHEGDGGTTASYRGGDFRIKKAAAGSGIVV